MKNQKEKRIKKIAIIGIGYIGLPLALEFHKFYKVIAYDFSKTRINQLNKKIDINNESDLKKINKEKIKFTNNESDLFKNDIFIICVPTPVLKNLNPDLSLIINATKLVSKFISKNSIVIFESTVYPGLTEEICLPILEKLSNMKVNKDFYLGYSPERINPADSKHNLRNVIKVISSSNNKSLKIIEDIYGKICLAGLHKAKSIKVAEGSKIIENIQRDINIALMNELSIIFDKLNIPFHEVLKASRTKWNFLDFHPGLVGGHCIGVDPYYMTYKSNKIKYNPKIILSGRKINDKMHIYISKKILNLCKRNNINPKSSRVLQLGITFKEDCSDFRNSKSIDLHKLLIKNFKKVDIYDPIVDVNKFEFETNLKLTSTTKNKKYDLIVISTSHKLFNKNIDYSLLLKKYGFIFSIKPFNKIMHNIKIYS